MKNKITFALTIAAAALVVAGCASNPNTSKVTHTYQAAGKAIKFGVVQDPITGQYSLGYQSGFIGGEIVPIFVVTNDAGAITVVMPDTVESYEIGGKGGFFGSAASTVTFATGPSAVQTLLGGQHPPINMPYWTNANITITSLPLASTLTPTVTSTANSSGTNGTSTATSAQAPIIIKP